MSPEITVHAKVRLSELTDGDVSQYEIIQALKDKSNLQFILRETDSRSICYLTVKDVILKLVLHRRTKKVITVLPWNDRYNERVYLWMPKFKANFEVELYPDCYLTTGKFSVMNTIHRIEEDGSRTPIPFDHPMFGATIARAWEVYKNGSTRLEMQSSDGKEGSTY